MRRPSRNRPETVVVLAGAVVAAVMVLSVVGFFAISHDRDGHGHGSTPTPTVSPAASLATSAPTETAGGEPTAVADEIDQLAAAPAIPAATHGRISGQDATQPDLYAAAFVRRLLTQDYRQSRDAHLAWVQAESVVTTEPLVVGLVPADLRPRMGVFSVTDPSTGDALVPAHRVWAALGKQGAYTTVTIQRVLEPLAWSDAVQAGRITDPGVTGRQVLATVTRHTGSTTKEFSVAVTLNIEGPPTTNSWRFVTVVSVRAVPSLSS